MNAALAILFSALGGLGIARVAQSVSMHRKSAATELMTTLMLFSAAAWSAFDRRFIIAAAAFGVAGLLFQFRRAKEKAR